MNKTKVSVIIPVYNSEKYLAECLESVINQTLKEIEILCINDGSSDNSLKILNEFSKKDERIKIFNQENKGAGSARNVGLKEAKGEFLAFLDSDDVYNVDYIEKMYNKAKNTNSDIVICAARSFDVITQEYASMPWSLETKLLPKKEIFNYKDIPDYIFNIAQNWNWNKLYKREFVEKNNIVFQEIYRTNDLLFTCKALVLAEKISVINEELVNYRISQETNCQSTNETHPFDFYCAFKELRKFLISKKIYKQVKKSYLAWAIDGCVYNIKSVKDVEIAKKIEKKVFQKGLKELGLKNYKIIKKEASYDFEAFEKMIKMRRKNFWQNIFSLRNSEDKKYKILTFFGVKFNLNLEKNRHDKRKYKMNKGDKNQGNNFIDSVYKEQLIAWYRRNTKKDLNLNNPKTFNEKMQWLKLYDSTPIKTRLADKYLVRDWVKEKIGEEYLIPLLGVYDKFEDIDFDKLPNRFVIKCNHGSGYNIIVKDKSELDFEDTKAKLDKWMNENFAFKAGYELHYRDIEPKIVIEEYLDEIGNSLYDYRFFCMNGRIGQIWLDVGSGTPEHKRKIYDESWAELDIKVKWPRLDTDIPKPKNLEKMIELSKIMSKEFALVRVDFYDVNDKIYFGELTFTSMSGVGQFEPVIEDLKLGRKIKLPKLAYNIDTGEYCKVPYDWKYFWQNVFSFKNDHRGTHKVLTVLGLKLKCKKRKEKKRKIGVLGKIFSVKNRESNNHTWYKVVRILGLKFSFKNKNLTLRKNSKLIKK